MIILLHHKEFNSLKVRIDVDIVHTVNKFNVTARGHMLETVSTQEADTISSVATPSLYFATLCNLSATDCLSLELSYLGTKKNEKVMAETLSSESKGGRWTQKHAPTFLRNSWRLMS